MSDMKCPFCGKKLVDRGYYDFMRPDECDGAGNIVGNESMWQELITTRKALDRAIWWLNEIVENHRFTPISTAEKALAEINEITKGNK